MWSVLSPTLAKEPRTPAFSGLPLPTSLELFSSSPFQGNFLWVRTLLGPSPYFHSCASSVTSCSFYLSSGKQRSQTIVLKRGSTQQGCARWQDQFWVKKNSESPPVFGSLSGAATRMLPCKTSTCWFVSRMQYFCEVIDLSCEPGKQCQRLCITTQSEFSLRSPLCFMSQTRHVSIISFSLKSIDR